ncbi:hypothetical protein QCA50_000659 [Cerrena zonata]|uniref:Actin cytoskeleton-regulatory complex protein SLA1 n=1 Tax=Cerrena zonata TaxID=2478898 RepID=A0AAW0GX72_9APHY
MASEPSYLAVLKAEFDYDPQPDAEDELAVKEDQIVLLVERTDEDWWKVRVKTDNQEDEGPTGLVPAAYVKQAPHTSVVKVLYDYDATQPTELTIKEDEILYSYGEDEGWLLVGDSEGTRAGYIPANYIEESGEGGESSTATPSAGFSLSQIVVPPSPPKPAYVDPADRVASNKAQADDIKTWAVSEIDKKGKKKKGTLGVGNGAIFFASESDKTPVQKWQTSDVQACKIDKPKHVLIEIGGASAISLHFHAGSKDTAEEILSKLESSRSLANGGARSSTSTPPGPDLPERPRSTAPKAVHFDASEPEIIPPPPEHEDDSEPEPEPVPQYHQAQEEEDALPYGDPAVVLYDFAADGEDELSVREGETLMVLERDGDEWWKCRNQDGLVGVVPASYVELVPGADGQVPPRSVAKVDDSAALAAQAAAQREAEEKEAAEQERAERERAEKDRKAQAEQRAKAAAVAAEADRRRREQEREKKEKERAITAAAAEEEARRKKKEEERERERKSQDGPKSPRKSGEPRSSAERRGPPQVGVRTWHDRTGQFKVDAAFLGYSNGKLRLHKINGVVIEVPAEKMSAEDMAYVEKATAAAKPAPKDDDDDDEPLVNRRKSLQPQARAQAKKGPTVDWFEFFLNAGCDLDDCTRYAHAFEKDKIDEAILPDLTESVMRTLGLREGDIIRVKKAIETRKPKTDEKAEQIRRDEELARQLQAEESGGKRGQAPNLFAGPNGALKNNSMRRGRPQPSKSLPPASVDLTSITSASDQIQRTSTPTLVASPTGTQTSPAPVNPPARSSSVGTPAIGFDDDAWTNRPSSTKPLTPTPAAAARAPSAPPAPTPPPAPPAPAAPAPPVAAPVIAQSQSSPPAPARPQSAGTNLANTTESDIFDQLARLSAYKKPTSPPIVSPPITTSPPIGYQTGMGMGSSPAPMGQHLQAQQTGMLPPPQSQLNPNAPRGPYAPVPANAALLQPLIPTMTGFNSFIPTRPASTPSSFQPPPPQPSFLNPQPTGFPQMQQPLMSQPTGFMQSGPLLSQPTGMPNGNFGNGFGNIPPVPPLPMNNGMNGMNGFNPVQINPTGFNPGYGQSPFNQSISPAPAPPPQPSQDNSPANIFAKMKSGNFGANDNSAPQDPNKYDVLRQNTMPLTSQPTGWGYGVNGMQTGYGYQR